MKFSAMLNFRIFNSYKVKKCKTRNCPSNTDDIKKMSECIFYHNEKDKRRYPIKINLEEMSQNIQILNDLKKSNFIISDFFKKYNKKLKIDKIELEYVEDLAINKNDVFASLNIFESNFHPFSTN